MPRRANPCNDDDQLYFGHGQLPPEPDQRALALGVADELAPVAPPRRRPVGRDDDLGFDAHEVRELLRML